MSRKLTPGQRLAKYDELAAQNRQFVARNTKNNAKALARYNEATANGRARLNSRAAHANGGYDAIAAGAQARNRRAIRTGGQW